MHRHGYQGRKFNREAAQRRALIKGLAESLVLHESIETTLPKAKEVASYTEKLITKAKKGGLHSRRQVIAGLHTQEAVTKLVDTIVPKLSGRNSGYLSVKRSRTRRGDNAQLAILRFVDDLKKPVKAEKPAATAAAKPNPAAKKPVAKPATKAKPTAKKPVPKTKKEVK